MIEEKEVAMLLCAISNNEIKPYLQPIVDINKNLKGFEVLSKWFKEKNIIIMPSDFIDKFKKSDLLLKKWTHSILERLILYFDSIDFKKNDLYINIYTVSLTDEIVHLLEVLNKKINVIVEILEDDSISDKDNFSNKMKVLSDKNIRFAIDDYGCGFNNRKRLEKYKFDVVKIDRAIIKNIDFYLRKVKKILNVAKKMKITVIAEGVENLKQIALLNKIGVHLYQGFYYHKPMPLEKIRIIFD